MISIVNQYLTKYEMIAENDLVVAGVSGGADSVCLLLQLCEYQKKVPFELKVVHINHMIREDAPEDAEYVRTLCSQRNIPFYLYCEDVTLFARENGLSTEEAGRLIRYKAFNEVLSAGGKAGKIAVAHNRNDVSETVLFNMFRGTGIEGLCSLAPVNGNIIRPLLGLSRKEIEQYLEAENIHFCTDTTNQSNDYARNRIRNVMLPYADENICSNAIEHVAALSDKMRQIRDYIKKQSQIAFEECVSMENEARINLDKFNGMEEVIQQEIILDILDRITEGRKDIGNVHVKNIIDLTGKSGEKIINLPYELEAVKQYNQLIIRKKCSQDSSKLNYEILAGQEILLNDGRSICTRIIDYKPGMEIPQKAYTKWFDCDKITNCLVLRNRESGDYLTVNSSMAKKSIKDYFINEKIPREDRDRQLMLAEGNHILWVIGYRISEYYKVTDETKRILEVVIR